MAKKFKYHPWRDSYVHSKEVEDQIRKSREEAIFQLAEKRAQGRFKKHGEIVRCYSKQVALDKIRRFPGSGGGLDCLIG